MLTDDTLLISVDDHVIEPAHVFADHIGLEELEGLADALEAALLGGRAPVKR